MMRRTRSRLISCACVAFAGGAAALAAGGGSSSVVAVPEALVVFGANGTQQLKNTSATTDFTIQTITRDPLCLSAVTESVAGGTPITLTAGSTKNVTISCMAGEPSGMERCLFHGSDNAGLPVVDFMGVCGYATATTLTASPTTFDFTTVVMGIPSTTTLTLTNTGAATIDRLSLQLDDLDGDFLIQLPCPIDEPYCEAPIAPLPTGSSTPIVVSCAPKHSGPLSAKLYIATDTGQMVPAPIQLMCTGVATSSPVLDASPLSVEVAAPVEVISGTASSTIRISNTGGGSLVIDDVETIDVDAGAAADWVYVASGKCSGTISAMTTCSLAQGDEVDLALTFDPSQIAVRRAAMLVTYHDTAERTLTIPLDGTGGGASLSLLGGTTAFDFGTVATTASSTITLDTVNTPGTRPTTATFTIAPTTGPFDVTPAMGPVAPGVTPTKFSATCTPTATGTATATITGAGSDTFASPPIQLSASCTGASSGLVANPTAVTLGEVRSDGGAITVPVVVQVIGGAHVGLQGNPTLVGNDATLSMSNYDSSTTPATFTLTVTPIDDVQQDHDLGNHVIVADTNGDTLSIPITGHSVTPSYGVQSIDVGTFCVGQPTTAKRAALTNGPATLELMAPTLQLGDASPFVLEYTAPSSYPSLIGPQQTASVELLPLRQMTAGSFADTLVWSTDDIGSGATATTPVTATFTATGGAIAPGVLDFNKAPIHIVEANAQSVTLQNCDVTNPLELEPPVIPEPFSIDSPNFPTSLPPQGSVTFSVGFRPTKPGPDTNPPNSYHATLTISSPSLATPLTVMLVGETEPVTPPGDAGSGSGGGSSCGGCESGPSTGWAAIVVIAIGVGARRRRRR